jgi:uncharacterized membrane protein
MAKFKTKKKKLHLNFIGLLGIILVFIIIFSYLSIKRYNSFEPATYDMGIMIQTIWNTSEGWFLQESINMGYPMFRFWMAHWEFIYLFIALFYKLFSTPDFLFIFQAAVVGLGAIPIYRLAKEKLNDHTSAFVFSICYLLYPAMHNATLFDIHGVTLAAPFLIYTFYYLQKSNYKLCALWGFIALMCREDSSLLLFMMGVYAFFIMKDKKVGLFTASVSLICFFLWYKRMTIRAMLGLPEFDIMEGADSHWTHLTQMKDSPLYLISHLAKKQNIFYFINLFGPVCFISLLSPSTLLIALPIFSINLLSSYHYTHGIEHQYSATIVPFIFISAIYGTNTLLNYLKNRVFKNKKRKDILEITYSLVFLLSLIFFFLKSNTFDAKNWVITDHHKIIKKVISEIPQDASLTALNKIVPHAAERHEVYMFDDHIDSVDYILYDFYASEVKIIDRSTYLFPSVWPYNDRIEKVLRNKEYGIVNYEDGVCLFKNGADYDNGIKKLALSVGAEIDISNTQLLNEQISLLGYNSYPQLKIWYKEEGIKGLQWRNELHFTCFWTTQMDRVDNFNFTFRIQNQEYKNTFSHSPVFGLYSPKMWKKNDIIKDEIYWEIPAEVKSGEYEVLVALQNDDNEIENKDFKPLFKIEIE